MQPLRVGLLRKPALGAVVVRLKTDCVESVTKKFVFDTLVERGRGGEGRRDVHLDEPWLKLVVKEDIKSEYLEAVGTREAELSTTEPRFWNKQRRH